MTETWEGGGIKNTDNNNNNKNNNNFPKMTR